MTHTDARTEGACPTQETLTAFLAASGALPPGLAEDWPRDAVSGEELRALSTHLATCDSCVEDLRTASRRLASAADIPMPVPSEVLARAQALAEPRAETVAGERAGWIAEVREWLSATIRMPVLVPAALAALALIVVVPRLQTTSAPQDELSRAVELRQPARVTAETAAVRAARSDDAAVLETLVRGDRAILTAEEDGWYRVALADGAEGWIERSAFE